MSEWRDQAVIIRHGQFHEADLWLKMLCREHGLFTIFAFGAVRSRRRFCGCLDTFNSLDCRIQLSRNGAYLNLREATLLDGPRKLRGDWRLMGMAANCLRFVEALAIDADSAPACFLLLENLRAELETAKNHSPLMPVFFRLRIAALLGFAPNLRYCAKCGGVIAGSGVFLADEGQCVCRDCGAAFPAGANRFALEVTAATLEFLSLVQLNQPDSWPDQSLSWRERAECGRLIDSFVQYHLGLVWDNGHFRKI